LFVVERNLLAEDNVLTINKPPLWKLTRCYREEWCL